MIGESVGEVVKIHDDTSTKSILCDGRILVICHTEHKISKQIALKVEEKWYEIQVIEEEWRSDLDWWLSDGDRRSVSVSESEYSSEQSNEEDQDWINLERCDEEDGSIDEEQLMKESLCNANSKFKNTEEEMESRDTEVKKDVRRDAVSGLAKECGPSKSSGPVGEKEIGLGDNSDLGRVDRQGGLTKIGKKGPNVAVEEGSSMNRDLESKELGGKRRRQLADCYPETGVELRTTKTQGTNTGTKQQQRGRADFTLGAASKVILTDSCSISDGCIANRNSIIRRELTLHEVRRMMSVGKRLGIQIQDNEGEVQSRFIELEERVEAGERKG
ncbi:hypothetical protein SLE2022_344410 [Rubroshorea leprosula]